MQVKVKCLLTSKAIFTCFSQKLPIKGYKTRLVKEKIKKELLEREFQTFSPIIFVNPTTFETIKEKTKNQKIGKAIETEFELDVSEILKSGFNILKERIIKSYLV